MNDRLRHRIEQIESLSDEHFAQMMTVAKLPPAQFGQVLTVAQMPPRDFAIIETLPRRWAFWAGVVAAMGAIGGAFLWLVDHRDEAAAAASSLADHHAP